MLSAQQDRALAALVGSGIRPEEGRLLAATAARVPKTHAIVEIGAYKGKSACYLGTGAQAGRGAHVYSIDLWDPEAHRPRSLFAERGILKAWKTQVARMGLTDVVTPIKGRSTDVAARWDGKKVGLLFIDGNHRYAAARADFDAWVPFVPKGGFVVIHDYGNPRWLKDVNRLVDETLGGEGWTEFEVVGTAAKARRT